MHRFALASLALFLLACPTVEEPPVECVVAADSWSEGEQAFRDATADWGLEDLVVLGTRVSVADVDGDGWPDLITRNGGGPDDFAVEDGQRRWVLRNTGEGTFEDISEASEMFVGRLDGVSGSRASELIVTGDIDNDGDVDVFSARNREDIYAEGAETSEVMLNGGDGTFVLRGDNAEFLDVLSVPVGATLSDVDLDGNLDIFISNNMRGGDAQPLQDRLFLGLGDGTFVESTEALGLETGLWNSTERLNEGKAHSWGWSAAACDLNNDGYPELMSASYGRAPNHLWQGGPGGAEGAEFDNVSVDSGYAYDHRADWTTNINAQCYCEDNPTAEDCDDAPTPDDYGLCQALFAGFGGNYRWNHNVDREPWRLGGNSATTTCADVNNDGFLDLFTGEIVHWDVGDTSDPAELMLNVGDDDVRFERPGNDALGIDRGDGGSGWDHGDMNNAVFDFDNDGRQDIYLSSSDYPDTRGFLFHQEPDGTFELVDQDEGVDHWRSAGAAGVDLDRDGDLDLVVGHTRMRCGGSMPSDCYDKPYVHIFENLANDRNNWLQLRLEGTDGSNRSAIGAIVTVARCDETLTRHVDGGHGIVGSQDDLVLHFGLGDMTDAEVTVHWPDVGRTTQTFTVATGARYDVRQGDDPTEWTP